MIKSLLNTVTIIKPSLRLNLSTPSYSFVLLKMLKKKLQQKQTKYKPEAETYSANPQQKPKSKQKQQQQTEIYQTQYDFFSRQKQIQLNSDYRKVRQHSTFIPSDIGKGGFDQVVYWSQFAKTPEQVVDLLRVFNRIQMPEEIGDKIRFRAFGDVVMKMVYLAESYGVLQEYATFGEKYDIQEPTFWRKIEQKSVRLSPKGQKQVRNCIQIAYTMSKMSKGQILYSSLMTLFKDIPLTAQDKAKLLLIYANTETGEKQWIDELMRGLIDNLRDVKKEVLILVLDVFKKTKNLPDLEEKKVMNRIQEVLSELSFRELCLAGEFIGHNKMPEAFWLQLQKYLIPLIPENKPKYAVLHLLELLSSYSMRVQFVRDYFVPLLRNNNHQLLHELPPEILSSISKTLYIYQLETSSKDIQQLIQTNIIKTFTILKNVRIQNLIKVTKDYTVTRVGSRELYIFLEQVTDAMFQQIRTSRRDLEVFCTLYENSQLCTPEFLKKLQHSL